MAPPAVPNISAKEFLLTLWGDAKGVAELAIIGSKLQKGGFKGADPYFYPESIDSLLGAASNHNRTDNVYMGVLLRREKWARGSRGTEALALCSMVVWAEFDFEGQGHKGKTVPEADVRKFLQEFPLKPSIIVRSGGGIQVYWLLKEHATGQELWRLKEINKAIAKHFGADTASVDLARVLRIPWTTNYNYDPPRRVEISWWHPEWRYILDDFDFLPTEELKIGVPSTSTATPVAAPAASAAPAPAPARSGPSPDTVAPLAKPATAAPTPIATPTFDLNTDDCKEIGSHLSSIWFEGARHEMALCVAGWFARAGVKEEWTKLCVQIASDMHGGDTKKRLKDVEDTYKNLTSKLIKGKAHIQEIIDALPKGKIQDDANAILKKISKKLPRPKGHKREVGEPDFKFIHLIQFTSQPSRWTVTIEKEGEQYVVTLDNARFHKYTDFTQEVLDQHAVAISANLKNHEWLALIGEAIKNNLFEQQEAPPEARSAGAIELALEEFLAEAKKDPDVGLLKKFAGFDEQHRFFKFATFHEFMDETDAKITKNHLREKLKDMGWKSDTKRFSKGGGVQRLWMKSIIDGGSNGNGNGNGNGHGAPTVPTPPTEPAPSADPSKTSDPESAVVVGAGQAGLFPVTQDPDDPIVPEPTS